MSQAELHGWESIDSGIELVNWSALAHGNRSGLSAQIDKDVFDERWTRLDPKYGRWLCWIAFSVGAECIVKGAFYEKGYQPIPKKWSFGGDLPWDRLGLRGNEDVRNSIKRLATNIRNRDAHAYIANQRDQNFDELGDFVSALSMVLHAISSTNAASGD